MQIKIEVAVSWSVLNVNTKALKILETVEKIQMKTTF